MPGRGGVIPGNAVPSCGHPAQRAGESNRGTAAQSADTDFPSNAHSPHPDTIAAVATAPGTAGIAILRVSGPAAEAILRALFTPAPRESHRLTHGRIVHQGETLDEAMAVLMRAPRSYTREDVVEFHCHGGDTACRRVLDAVLSLGARPAMPGEFTRRAFENGRIDLAQAEAAMRLIGATGEAAARAALRQMDGAVSVKIQAARGRLTAMLAEIAACTDFPDEIDEAPTADSLIRSADALAAELRAACNARRGRVLETGLSVVLAGKPNVGKSSLLNALLGEDRAIVTAQPGTTRDAVHGHMLLDGVRVNLTDTAGLRDAGGEAESIGIERARRAIAAADLLLIVLDASLPLAPEDAALLAETEGQARLVVLNKSDLPPVLDIAHDITISARTGEGVDALRARIAAAAAQAHAGDALLTEARHVDAAARAAAALDAMAGTLRDGLPVDLAAVDAAEALRALGEITGEDADESVIDAVFRDFCVGK